MAEIIVTCFVFHMIYQIPLSGLYGFDSYLQATIANGILNTGHISQSFPNMDIFGAQLSMITGIDILNVAKWFPSVIDVLLIIMCYLLVNFIFKKREIALLSSLLLACLQDNVEFGSLFVDETMALILMVCCIYIIFTAEKKNKLTNAYFLAGIFLFAIILSHHLTSLLFVIFLSIQFILTKLSGVIKIKNLFFKEVTKINIDLFYILFTCMSLSIYWIYAANSPIIYLADDIKNFFFRGGGVSSYSAAANVSPEIMASMRGYLLYYGFFFFIISFGIIMLFSLIRWARGTKLEIFSFTFFLFICGAIGFISLFVSNMVYPDRLLTYGWLFGFSPLVWAIIRKRSIFFKAGIIMLILFMMFNIYSVDPSLWNPSSNTLPPSPSAEDNALAHAFNFPPGGVASFESARIILTFTQNRNVTGFSDVGKVNVTDFNIVVIDENTLKIYQNSISYSGNLLQLSQLENGSFISEKLYSSNSLSVWQPNIT